MKQNINRVLQNTLGIIGLRKTKWILWVLSFLSFTGVTFLLLFMKTLQHISSLAEGMVVVMNRNKWFKNNISAQTIKDHADKNGVVKKYEGKKHKAEA